MNTPVDDEAKKQAQQEELKKQYVLQQQQPQRQQQVGIQHRGIILVGQAQQLGYRDDE